MVGLGGLEPPTSHLSGAHSNQLSYRPIELVFPKRGEARNYKNQLLKVKLLTNNFVD